MKKLILTILMLISLCNTSHANVMEDIQKQYPKIKISENITFSDSGKEIKSKIMTIYTARYLNDIPFTIMLGDHNGVKSVLMNYYYIGYNWKFLNKVSVGNGENVIYLNPCVNPNRYVEGGKVQEIVNIMPTIEQLKFMKNTKIMKIHGNNNSWIVETNRIVKHRVPYFEAIDYAIKFLEEK